MTSSAGPVVPRRSLSAAALVAGVCACAALAAATIAGHEGSPIPAWLFAALALGALVVAAGVRLRTLIAAPEGPLIGLLALAVVLVIAAGAFLGNGHRHGARRGVRHRGRGTRGDGRRTHP